jgi:hypothetical protein
MEVLALLPGGYHSICEYCSVRNRRGRGQVTVSVPGECLGFPSVGCNSSYCSGKKWIKMPQSINGRAVESWYVIEGKRFAYYGQT